MILASLTKEFKTSIAKDMYRITWTAGSVSLAAICAPAFDLILTRMDSVGKRAEISLPA